MNEETKEAIAYMKRVVEIGKNTAYSLRYNDIDIACIEILLNYIKDLTDQLEKNKELIMDLLENEVKNLKKEAEEFRAK